MPVQVLSNSVAEALAMENKPHLSETVRFVKTFNKFFDLLNVRSLTEAQIHRNPNVHVRPYRSVDDDHFKVIANVCA